MNAAATILVVDDEFGVAEVLESILEDEGYRIVTAINGRQGLVRLKEIVPDLALIDYMMPIMDGAALLAAMRADPGLAAIPVVMMSSLDEMTVRETCSGIRGFLRKPFRVEDVIGTVKRALEAEDEPAH